MSRLESLYRSIEISHWNVRRLESSLNICRSFDPKVSPSNRICNDFKTIQIWSYNNDININTLSALPVTMSSFVISAQNTASLCAWRLKTRSQLLISQTLAFKRRNRLKIRKKRFSSVVKRWFSKPEVEKLYLIYTYSERELNADSKNILVRYIWPIFQK